MYHNLKVLVAKTYEDFERLELNLIQEGFKLYDISASRMKYHRRDGATQYRADIVMKFWDGCREINLPDHVPGMVVEPMQLPEVTIPEDFNI